LEYYQFTLIRAAAVPNPSRDREGAVTLGDTNIQEIFESANPTL